MYSSGISMKRRRFLPDVSVGVGGLGGDIVPAFFQWNVVRGELVAVDQGGPAVDGDPFLATGVVGENPANQHVRMPDRVAIRGILDFEGRLPVSPSRSPTRSKPLRDRRRSVCRRCRLPGTPLSNRKGNRADSPVDGSFFGIVALHDNVADSPSSISEGAAEKEMSAWADEPRQSSATRRRRRNPSPYRVGGGLNRDTVTLPFCSTVPISGSMVSVSAYSEVQKRVAILPLRFPMVPRTARLREADRPQ